MESQGKPGNDDFEFALQNARNIAETYTFLTVNVDDPASLTAMERYRDQVMAETTTWWQRRTGGRILLSAQDDHVGYTATDPTTYPKTQGAFLHDTLGADYLAIGTTFDRGSFLSKDQALGGDWKTFTVPLPAPARTSTRSTRSGTATTTPTCARPRPRLAPGWTSRARRTTSARSSRSTRRPSSPSAGPMTSWSTSTPSERRGSCSTRGPAGAATGSGRRPLVLRHQRHDQRIGSRELAYQPSYQMPPMGPRFVTARMPGGRTAALRSPRMCW